MSNKSLRRRADRSVNFGRKITSVFATIPAAILVVALVLFFYRDTFLTSQALSTLSIISYSLAIVGMAISVGFSRSRIFFVLLLLVLSQLAFSLPAPDGWGDRAYYGLLYYFCTLLLPINILVLSLLEEQGPLSAQGKRRLIFILVQLLLAVVIFVAHDQDMLGYIQQELLPPVHIINTALPAKALTITAVGLLLLFVRQLMKFSVVDNAFFFCLLTLVAAFHFGPATLALPLFLTAATIMLTVAVIQDLYSIAYLDELTGLPARRSLQEEMAKLGDRYAIAMVDIDFFKKVNDKYGHDVGDDALRFLAAILRQEVADKGRVFRYGGEEFTILFSGRGLSEVQPSLEELRQSITRRHFFLRGKTGDKKLALTVSIGAAEHNSKQLTAEQVIKAADMALYRAKELGRNCVVS